MNHFREYFAESVPFISNELEFKNIPANSKVARLILDHWQDDLPLYVSICEKSDYFNSDIVITFVFDPTLPQEKFVGYYVIGKENHFEPNTLNLNQIEIRKSLRDDKTLPRYGKTVLERIINAIKDTNKYEGITLQANNDHLFTQVYPKYGFVPLGKRDGANKMILRF